MKYIGVYWTLFAPMIKKSITKRFGRDLAEKAVKDGKAEYRHLLSRADDLGPGNPMAMNAYFAYVFAAAWLGSNRKITPDEDLPDYSGSKNGHAKAIYGGLLIFALYPALPDQPPISDLQDFVQNMFMGPFTKLGKIFDLNRPSHMRLIDKVFRKSGNRDRKDILKYPEGFINIDAPYDIEHHAASYSFTQCPNAEFAKKHGLLHVLPLMCNSDFFGISEIHGTLIRCGTCGNSNMCDYLVVGNSNPIAATYETVTDEQGFLVSRKRLPENIGNNPA